MGRLITSPWRPHAGQGTMARLRVVLSRKTTSQAQQPTRCPSPPKLGVIAVLLSQRVLRVSALSAGVGVTVGVVSARYADRASRMSTAKGVLCRTIYSCTSVCRGSGTRDGIAWRGHGAGLSMHRGASRTDARVYHTGSHAETSLPRAWNLWPLQIGVRGATPLMPCAA